MRHNRLSTLGGTLLAGLLTSASVIGQSGGTPGWEEPPTWRMPPAPDAPAPWDAGPDADSRPWTDDPVSPPAPERAPWEAGSRSPSAVDRQDPWAREPVPARPPAGGWRQEPGPESGYAAPPPGPVADPWEQAPARPGPAPRDPWATESGRPPPPPAAVGRQPYGQPGYGSPSYPDAGERRRGGGFGGGSRDFRRDHGAYGDYPRRWGGQFGAERSRPQPPGFGSAPRYPGYRGRQDLPAGREPAYPRTPEPWPRQETWGGGGYPPAVDPGRPFSPPSADPDLGIRYPFPYPYMPPPVPDYGPGGGGPGGAYPYPGGGYPDAAPWPPAPVSPYEDIPPPPGAGRYDGGRGWQRYPEPGYPAGDMAPPAPYGDYPRGYGTDAYR